MKSVNLVLLMGNVGKNPEVKIINETKKKVTISLATNERFKNKKGEKVTITDWHNLVAWGKLAEIIEKYVTKGAFIQVEGKHKTESYEGKDGVIKYNSYILLSSVQVIDSKFSEAKEVQEAAVTTAEEEADDLPF